ncbi:MAG: hypothetical protein WKF92_09910 [Pyrinomonadaceae bacterium]
MPFLNKLQIVTICGIMLAVMACGALSKKEDVNAPAASPNSAKVPTLTASSDPKADVVKAMRASFDAKSYRSRITTTSSNGSNQVVTAEIVAPDKMHMLQEMKTGNGQAVKSERIIIGKESFVKAGDGPWQKDPMDLGDLVSQFRDPKLIEAITEKAEVKYLGTDTLDGEPMLVYLYTITNMLGPGNHSVTKNWISAADGHLRQSESEIDLDLGTGKRVQSKTTVSYYDYDVGITIERPSL